MTTGDTSRPISCGQCTVDFRVTLDPVPGHRPRSGLVVNFCPLCGRRAFLGTPPDVPSTHARPATVEVPPR